MSPAPDKITISGSLAVFLGLCLLVALGGPLGAPQQFLADDSYFYVIIAQNLAAGLGPTFDTVYPTNGFHPLWLAVLGAFFAALAPPLPGLTLTAILHGALTLSALALFMRLGRYLKVTTPLTLAGAVPLIILLCCTGTLGSEGAISAVCILLALLAMLRLVADRSLVAAALFGLSLAAMFLARLDNAFLVLMLGSYAMWHAGLRPSLVAGAIAAALVAPYLSYNALAFGGMTPISGALKSAFPALDPAHFGHVRPIHVGLTVIAVFAAGWLALSGGRHRALAAALAAAALLQFAYHYLFQIAAVWHWYSILSAVGAGLNSGLLAQHLARRSVVFARLIRAATIPALIFAFIFAAAASVYKGYVEGPTASEVVARELADHIPPGARVLVADFQGRKQYFGGFRAICLNGLTSDRSLGRQLASMAMPDYIAAAGIDYFIEYWDKNIRCAQDESADGAFICRFAYGLDHRKVETGQMIRQPEDLLFETVSADDRRYRVWRAR